MKFIRIAAGIYLLVMIVFVWGYLSGRNSFFPGIFIEDAVEEIDAFIDGGKDSDKSLVDLITMHPLVRKSDFPYQGFNQVDRSFTDTGYLLVPRYEPNADQSIVELIRLADFSVVHTWVPPVEDIIEMAGRDIYNGSRERYYAQHPLMLSDGSIVFNSGWGPLVRIDRDSKILWMTNFDVHHSIELDINGNIVVPLMSYYFIKYEDGTQHKIRNDKFGVLNQEGEVLERYDVEEILLTNGFRGIYLGIGNLQSDRMHLNDVQPILKNNGSAQVGDFALSLRNLSTVLLYRPSENRIIWLKTGPWLYQHDVDQLEDGSFSIFGNDIFRRESKVLPANNISQVYIYTPETDQVSIPYDMTIKQAKMQSNTEGRSTILENGDVFIEETNKNRLMRLGKDQVRWYYANMISEDTSGSIHWSRYLPGDSPSLLWLEE
ncbi:arylsulfotransferase family protein [Cerasicoccus frondis]|uniref:arylsulfotransferase family protein n=1 Tax=Cerasicoccus frondis TaxID=490090 RepID=UPI0028528EDE|nr:arylsulfotransferase family protein [Cerasicoccus frondis]